MSLFDDNPLWPPNQNGIAQPSEGQTAAPSSGEPLAPGLAGDPISYAATSPASKLKSYLPDDLRISWSWPHLIVFMIFGFASLLIVQLGGIFLLSADRHLTQKQLQQMIESKPQFLVGTNVLWYALLFLFLYMTLAVLRGLPFWRSLGWKRLNPDPTAGKGSPWMYFLSGCGLAIFVALASSRVKNADHVPIQELFKNRNGAMLLMAMAVFVAPLVEETVFRGYQLGWTWGLVSLLILVGVIFTFARAWTGTVLASFLLHLGYNSMIAVTAIIATKGFSHMPPGH